MLRRSVQVAVVAGLALATASCGEPSTRFDCHPVRGLVVVRGKPLKDVMVVFHPVDPKFKIERPIAYTDAGGEFRLTTYTQGDGAPAGDYKVALQMRPNDGEGGDQVTSKSKLDWKYARPDTTELKFTVAPGENDVGTLTVN